MRNVAVLVDVQNVYYTTKSAFGCHFNYRELWRRVSTNHRISAACAYAIDSGDNKQRQFQNILRNIGFEVKLKPYIQRSDGSAKGDWDVGITLDAMHYAAAVDKITLVSGDGDFDLLAARVKSQFDIEFEVYGVEALTANSLIAAATRFIPIEQQLLLDTRSSDVTTEHNKR